MTEPAPPADDDAGTPILDELLTKRRAPDVADPPEPDEFDVHPGLIGEPLIVDYDTGETLTHEEAADKAAASAVVDDMAAQSAEHPEPPPVVAQFWEG